jgi:hypothetical protein
MDDRPLKTLKEVADHFNRPAHRIIHLCEAGVVRPAVGAAGRGSVRRFCRDDAFRVLLALELQEAGVQAPLIQPLMGALDHLMELPEVKKLRDSLVPHDLVAVVRYIGSQDSPVRAYLTPPDRVALVTPRLLVPSRPDVRVDLHLADGHLLDRGVCIVASLTRIAEYLHHTLFADCDRPPR